MKIKHISMSLVALIAMGSQVLAQTPPDYRATGTNDSQRSGDFKGLESMGPRVNDCGVNVSDANLSLPSTAFQISTEYLIRKDYNATLTNPVFTLGIGNPATVSDATIEIQFPSMINTASIIGTTIIDTNPAFAAGNPVLSHSNSVANNIETFDTASSTDLVTGHSYCISSDGTTCLPLDVGIAQNTYEDGTTFTGNIEWNIYSNSGTAERRDYVAMPLYYVVKDQFSIVCRSDFDGLINWENGRKSFVANKHDVDNGAIGDVQDTVKDSLIFTIDNLAGRTGLASLGSANPCASHKFDTWLEGNATEFDITSTGDLTIANFPDAQRTLVSSSANVADGAGAWITDNLTTFTTAAEPIPFGTTEYTITYDHTTGYAIPAVIPTSLFTGNVDLEADGNGSTYLHPQVSMPTNRSVGTWMDHAFIAQIAGASSTFAGITTDLADKGNTEKGLQTKLFIVNRSCAVATPIFKIIKDGDTVLVTDNTTGIASIPVNEQGFYLLADVLKLLGQDVSATDYGRYAVEVVLAGEAEDFYIYAQVKNKSLGQFKDLPVYSTSTRD